MFALVVSVHPNAEVTSKFTWIDPGVVNDSEGFCNTETGPLLNVHAQDEIVPEKIDD